MGSCLRRNLPTANVSSGNFPLSHLSISYSGEDPGRSSRRSAALSDYMSFDGPTWRPDSRVPGRAHSRTRLVHYVHTTLFICCQALPCVGFNSGNEDCNWEYRPSTTVCMSWVVAVTLDSQSGFLTGFLCPLHSRPGIRMQLRLANQPAQPICAH